MVKNVGATNENRRNRINCILKHIIKYKESQKKLTEKRLLLLLARDGHNITRAQLGKDKQSIREENTFVADLAKYSYSQIMEDEMNIFYSLRDRLRRLFDSKKAIETVFTMVNDEGKQKTIKIAKTPNELLVIKQMTDITFTINKIINGTYLMYPLHIISKIQGD